MKLKDILTAQALAGNRTKIIAVLIVGVLNGLLYGGIITQEQFQFWLSVATGAGLLTAAAHQPKS